MSLQDDAWQEWPLLATDGDSASLIQLVSDDKVNQGVSSSLGFPILILVHESSSLKLIQRMRSLRDQHLIGTAKKQVRLILFLNMSFSSNTPVDDDQIETAVSVRTLSTPAAQPLILSPESTPVPILVDFPSDINPAHGQSVDGGIASCRRLTSTGLADCMVCLEDEWTSFNDSITPDERELAMHILAIVRQGAEHGITKSHLRVSPLLI